ncbi:MAG: ferrochelatase [Magnetococcales bacterium]|nr:ferrochelatase [Magnetococcales bacterium]
MGPAVLFIQLGTPAAPTAPAVRDYLAEFLSDPRVVDLPRLPWWLLLHGVILRTRPDRSAALYRAIWRADGTSPLLHHSRQQALGVAQALGGTVAVDLAMRYGQPALADRLQHLLDHHDRLLVFPLYPQYAGSTTGSTLEAVSRILTRRRVIPALRWAGPFHDHPAYIQALAVTVGPVLTPEDHLLLSFHGLPQRHVDQGDPYAHQCRSTAERLAQALALTEDRWSMAFQSRFGRDQWLQPATDALLRDLPRQGRRHLVVACPGFVADCLETLEEIGRQGRETFLQAGGASFRMVPCLNDHPQWLAALAALVRQELAGWLET